jgi:Spy/CpxP family protein refolding chaperone
LFLVLTAFLCILVVTAALTEAQAQPGGKGKGKGGKGGLPETADSFVGKMMAFNKAKDGKLTKAELTDTRLAALFDRADANKDGIVTREELAALYTREQIGAGPGGFGEKGKGDKGKGEKKGGFFDKGGLDKGKGGKGGFPQPGTVLNPFFQDLLNLTDDQKKQVADLQKEVDVRLDKILTPEQRQQLRDMSAPKGFGDKKGPPAKKGDAK